MFIWASSFGGKFNVGGGCCLLGLLGRKVVSVVKEESVVVLGEYSMGDGKPGEGRIKRLSMESLASESLRLSCASSGDVGLVVMVACCWS